MSDEKAKRNNDGRYSRPDNGREMEQFETSDYRFVNETANGPKITSTPLKSDLPSGSVTISNEMQSRRKSIEMPDDESPIEEVIDSDNLTYTKYDSGSNKKGLPSPVDSMRKVEDYLMKHEQHDSESPDNNEPVIKQKRRKSKKQRKERFHSMESKQTDDDEIPHYEEEIGEVRGRSIDRRNKKDNEKSVERKERRRKSKKERKEKSRSITQSTLQDDDNIHDVTDARRKSAKFDSEQPRIAKRKKKRRSKGDSNDKQEKELPITEILRKAQENSRNHYEEPVALAELTTDKIYIQRRNRFSAVKISGNQKIRGHRFSISPGETLYPIKVAIIAQKVWNSIGLIHQGLLAGIAMMHLILIQTFFELSLDFLIDYSLICELYTNIFSFLATMCVVSVFDKFDLAHLALEHFREIYAEHSRSFLAVPLYISTFLLHQATLQVDDKISLMHYSRNITGLESNSTEILMDHQLLTWEKLTLAKDSLAIVAWLFVALGPGEDMLLTHLKTMVKYADTPDMSHEKIEGIIEERSEIDNRRKTKE